MDTSRPPSAGTSAMRCSRTTDPMTPVSRGLGAERTQRVRRALEVEHRQALAVR